MNEVFLERIKAYFGNDYDRFLEKMKEPCTQAFFLNTRKADKQEILSLIDFDYQSSPLTDESFYHSIDNIGKRKAYELGLIYPQEIAASLTSRYIKTDGVKLIVDLCAAPGGKTINVLNRIWKRHGLQLFASLKSTFIDRFISFFNTYLTYCKSSFFNFCLQAFL